MSNSESLRYFKRLKRLFRDFPGGTVVKNPPPKAGDAGSIPGQGTRSHVHAAAKSSHAATKEPTCCN